MYYLIIFFKKEHFYKYFSKHALKKIWINKSRYVLFLTDMDVSGEKLVNDRIYSNNLNTNNQIVLAIGQPPSQFFAFWEVQKRFRCCAFFDKVAPSLSIEKSSMDTWCVAPSPRT